MRNANMKDENIKGMPFFSLPREGYLKIEQILIEFDVPLLFTCRADKQLYLCLCTNSSAYPCQFLITATTPELLIKMLKNKITMYDAFKKSFELFPHSVYKIVENEDISKNIVEKLIISEIQNSDLPNKDSNFEIDLMYVHDYIAELEHFTQISSKRKIIKQPSIRSTKKLKSQNK